MYRSECYSSASANCELQSPETDALSLAMHVCKNCCQSAKHRKSDGILVFFSFLETIIYLTCNLRPSISRDQQAVGIWRIHHAGRLYMSAFQTRMCAQVSLGRLETQIWRLGWGLRFYSSDTLLGYLKQDFKLLPLQDRKAKRCDKGGVLSTPRPLDNMKPWPNVPRMPWAEPAGRDLTLHWGSLPLLMFLWSNTGRGQKRKRKKIDHSSILCILILYSMLGIWGTRNVKYNKKLHREVAYFGKVDVESVPDKPFIFFRKLLLQETL